MKLSDPAQKGSHLPLTEGIMVASQVYGDSAMWFGLLVDAKADAMIPKLADLGSPNGLGPAAISSILQKFRAEVTTWRRVVTLYPVGFSGVSMHPRCAPAYENLRTNALLVRCSGVCDGGPSCALL